MAEKKNILQDGAEKLTGKKCYICDGNISYLDEKTGTIGISRTHVLDWKI